MTATSDDDVAIAGLYSAGWLLCHESLAELVGIAPSTLEALGVARSCVPVIESARRCVGLIPEARVEAAVGPNREALASVQQHTPPGTWSEGLLKGLLIVGYGIDLTRHTRHNWPPAALRMFERPSPGPDLEKLLGETLAALELGEEAHSRTSMLGRRVIAELSAQTQRIASRAPELVRALTGVRAGSEDEVSSSVALLQGLVEGAAQRMLALGFQP